MLDQLKALLELKTQLFWRRFRGAEAVSTALHFCFMILTLLLGCGIGIGMFVLCSSNPPTNPGSVILIGSDIGVALFLFVWLFGLLIEIQRTDVVDFKKMLYLPISLRAVFLLNYGASLFAPILFLFAPVVLGASLGLTVKLGYRMLLVIPLAVAFYLAVGAWSYYVQGILAALMENKRRRRAIIAGVSILIAFLPQAPNLFNVTVLRGHHPLLDHFLVTYLNDSSVVALNMLIPVGWLPYSIHALATGVPAGVVLSFLAMVLLTVAGLSLGLRSTWRYYTGVGSRKIKKKAATAEIAQTLSLRTLIDRQLPFVDEETSALAMAGLLSYARHPQMRLMLIMPFILLVIFGGTHLMRGQVQNATSVPLVLLGVVLLPFLNFAPMMFNIFGSDANGFRVFVLLPTERRKYLAGKNLAIIPFLIASALPLVIVMTLLSSVSLKDCLIALLQIPSLFLMFCAMGNPLSAWFPYRMQSDGMQKKRVGGAAGLIGLLLLPMMALISIPTIACMLVDSFVEKTWGYQGVSIGIIASLCFLGAAFYIYRLTLEPSGRLLQRREQQILDKFQHDKD